MKKITAFSSLLLLGTVGLWVTANLLNPGDLDLNFADEDIHLYL